MRGAICAWFAVGLALAQQNAALRPARLYEVASSKNLNNVNRNDARAAIKVWAELVAKQRGFLLDSKVDIVDSVAEIVERLETHSVDALMITVAEFMDLETKHPVLPVFVPARGGESLYSYVLLVKPSSATTTLAGLRGKSLVSSSRTSENAGIAWLDVTLGKERLGRAASFFGSIKTADRPQGCILPLFFGTVDACVVDEVNLNLAKEMNPQLGQLRVLARSRPMTETVIATPLQPQQYQKEWMEALMSLHEDPRGRQMLMVFKTERVIRFQPGDLDSARELWRDYYRLPGSVPNHPPMAPAMASEKR
jgi:ABC-type phosphate/phosphonate transport system substrate-binding protein